MNHLGVMTHGVEINISREIGSDQALQQIHARTFFIKLIKIVSLCQGKKILYQSCISSEYPW